MRYLICVLLFSFSLLSSAVLEVKNKAKKICGAPEISSHQISTFLNKIKESDPVAYQRILNEHDKSTRAAAIIPGDTTFWAYKFTEGLQPGQRFYTIVATLKRVGTVSRIWVEKESLTGGLVTENVLDTLLLNLEQNSGPGSIDPTKGIVEIDTDLFGQPPNFDGDGLIDFLILDIQDDYDPNGNSSFIAGYFSTWDQTLNVTSNKRDLLYLDSNPGIFNQGTYQTDRVLSTTAHELQHLIHFNYDQNESHWINEGLSELAGTYCGYGLDFPNLYLNETNRSLVSWNNEVKDYARVNLFSLYCAEQFGLPFILNLTQSPMDSIASFNSVLLQSGYNQNLADVFINWAKANWVNNHQIDSRLGYQLADARGLKASATRLIVEYPAGGVSNSGQISDYAVEYHRFRGKDSLNIEINQQPAGTFWMVVGEQQIRIEDNPLSPISEPDFSGDSTYVLGIVSTQNLQPYQYLANANYSLKYFDIGYDSGQPQINLTFQGSAANKFLVPENGLKLEAIKFWNGSENNRVKIHAYGKSVSGLPGAELMPVIDTLLSSATGWTEIAFPTPVENLNKNQTIFVGVELTGQNKSIGYEDTNTPAFSYINTGGGWDLLSNRQLGGTNEPADGVWLIHAVLSGFVSSDSIAGKPISSGLQIVGGYPNPYRQREKIFTIQYDVQFAGKVRMEIYNVLGQQIAVREKTLLEDGLNTITWDGNGVGSGVYFYRLIYRNAINGEETRSGYQKILLVH